MTFAYEAPSSSSAIRQAEILQGLTEYRAVGLDSQGALEYLVIYHPAVAVLSQDCDLEQDRSLRFPSDADAPTSEEIETDANSLAQVLLCEAYGESEVRAKFANFGSKDWRRIQQNQNERYHCFAAAQVGPNPDDVAEAIYIDFRKHFTVPTGFLYDRVSTGDVVRRAVIPPIHSHDLIHRFYGYQSRVALP